MFHCISRRPCPEVDQGDDTKQLQADNLDICCDENSVKDWFS